MKTSGIRIEDIRSRVLQIKLKDILEEVQGGNLLYWSIQYFFGSGQLKNGKILSDFEKEVKSEKGFLINWIDLNELAATLDQVWGIIIIGCKNQKLILRYEDDQVMYETCDIVIELVDSTFWEIFSKDPALINRLIEKFKDKSSFELLDSNFLK